MHNHKCIGYVMTRWIFVIAVIGAATGASMQPLEGFAKALLPSKNNFFSSLGPHETPLRYCGDKKFGKVYSLPDIPTCDFEAEDEVLPVPYLVTFYGLNLEKQHITGYRCTKVLYWDKRWFEGFAWSQKKIQLSHEYKRISVEECKRLAFDLETPEGEKLTFNKDGSYSFEEKNENEYTWPKTTEKSNKAYYVETYGIIIDPNTNLITTAAEITKDCELNEEHCPAGNGMLIWKANNITTCQLKESETEACYKTNATLLCPQKQMLMTKIQTTTICGLKLYTSEQRLLFSPYNTTWDEGVGADTLTVRKSLKRTRRGINETFRFDSSGTLNAKLEFLQKLTLENLLNLKQTICQTQGTIVQKNRISALKGNVDELITTYLGINFKGALEGDNILVWSCTEIRNYRFLENEQCHLEWPVEFKLDGRLVKGFMDRSHEIHLSSVPSNCPTGPFYFTGNGKSVLLNHQTQGESVQFQQFPIMNPFGIEKLFTTTTFTSMGEYNLQDLQDFSSRTLFMDIQKNKRILKSIENYNEPIYQNVDYKFLTELKNLWNSDIYKFSTYLIIAIVGIILSVFALYMCIEFNPLKLLIGCINRARTARKERNRRMQREMENLIGPNAPPQFDPENPPPNAIPLAEPIIVR